MYKEKVIKEMAEGKKFDFLFFWKNTPIQEIGPPCLSQWWTDLHLVHHVILKKMNLKKELAKVKKQAFVGCFSGFIGIGIAIGLGLWIVESYWAQCLIKTLAHKNIPLLTLIGCNFLLWFALSAKNHRTLVIGGLLLTQFYVWFLM